MVPARMFSPLLGFLGALQGLLGSLGGPLESDIFLMSSWGVFMAHSIHFEGPTTAVCDSDYNNDTTRPTTMTQHDYSNDTT